MPNAFSESPRAYLLTFHTYGTWLHGEAQGSVDRKRHQPGTAFLPADPKRLAAMQSRMVGPPKFLDAEERIVVEAAIRGVCDHRGWELITIHVRTNHVHTVTAAPVPPERVMNDFKSWSTRRLREAGLVAAETNVWSRHGSTRYLWNEAAVQRAALYVVEGQGIDLD